MLTGLRDERDRAKATVNDLARLAHDIAAPITALWATLERVAPDERGATWQALTLHLDHLHILVSRQLARLRGQPSAAPRRTPVDVAAIRDAVIVAFAEQARRAGITLDCNPGTEQTTVRGDSVAIRRILDNLVSNALGATPCGGRVMVELWDDRKLPLGLTISVSDTGGGISEADQRALFLGRGTHTGGSGLGLGLTIVRELAEAMGGSCGLESEPEKGSHFWVRLPQEGTPDRGATQSTPYGGIQ